jgi:hypothetical protein
MYCSNGFLKFVPTERSAVLCTALTAFLKLCQQKDKLFYVYVLLNKPITISGIYSCILYTLRAKVLSQQIAMFQLK